MTDKLTVQDCLDVGFCIYPGVKAACKKHSIDFRTLVKEGVPLADLKGLNDANVSRAIARAEERIASSG